MSANTLDALLMALLTPALFAILIAGALLVIVTDWRLSFGALVIEYVGAAILLLSRRAGSFITGEDLYVDGGFTSIRF